MLTASEPKSAETADMLFLHDVMKLVIEHLNNRTDPTLAVRPIQMTANETRRALSLDSSNALGPANGRSHESLLQSCGQIIAQSLRTAHPNFVSQIYSKADLYGVAAEIIVAALNNNVHVFQLAPALTVIEQEMISYLASLFELSHSAVPNLADGIFVPGGSVGNLQALYVALYHADPSIRENGFQTGGGRYVAFCSEDAHYSIEKAAMVLGIGRSGLCKIPCDHDGRMRVNEFEQAVTETITRGDVPFFVCATAGTTVLSAFDPLIQIASIARRYGLWLHVDAAWGGAAAFSKQHRSLLVGSSQADSLTFSAHKMLGAPIQCVALLINARHHGLLRQATAVDAPYLYQSSTSQQDEEPDPSRSSFQCGRRADALKLWLMREALGNKGLSTRVEKCATLAKGFRREIDKRIDRGAGYVLYKHTFSTVCFWYVPEDMPPPEIELLRPEDPSWILLNDIAIGVRNRLFQSGAPVLVGHGSVRGLPNFFRIGLSSAPDNRSEFYSCISDVLDSIENFAETVVAARQIRKLL